MSYQSIFKSPIGNIIISATSDAVVGVKFSEGEQCLYKETEFPSLPAILKQAHTELNEYFNGERVAFSVKTEYGAATDFRKKVYNALINIPYGKTASYKQIAEQIGSPKASRAVGGANHNNKICILVPCHRVIGVNGKPVGYAGGLDRKQWLLEHEASKAQPARQ